MAEPLKGLTDAEVKIKQAQYGPNQVKEDQTRPWHQFVLKFWSPIPWMLELTLVLEVFLHKPIEAIIIGFLLIFNAVLGFSQERKAKNALELLRERLRIQARVLRNGQWSEVPAAELVPDDVVHLRMGDFAPADIELVEGEVLVDQSALTGESAPVERTSGSTIYSGSTIRRGESTGIVTATGAHSYFGKTTELVRTAGAQSHLEGLVLGIIRYLVLLDGILVAAILLYATSHAMGLSTILPFALILLVASVPVALPATFTLTTALASLSLAKNGVLVTRLAAIEEAAAMNQLCSDKTGTLTRNELTVSSLLPRPDVSEDELLTMAAAACDAATQDPLDLAILAEAQHRSLPILQHLTFIPFDPSTKHCEATFSYQSATWISMKGAPQTIAELTGEHDWQADAELLAQTGARILAIAAGPVNSLRFLGLVALSDPPRDDAFEVLTALKNLGIRVRMITGDSLPTARAVAQKLGLDGPICEHKDIVSQGAQCQVYAGVFPEDKFHIVQSLQKQGFVTGMTGDGVNDAPALKQAEVGIAVASATDVAKASASLVLTRPGLKDVITAVITGREIYQRLLTYTLNKIVKTVQVAVFLSLGLLIYGQFVVTPLLVLLLLFANDFVTMSIAGDRVRHSPKPDRWDVRVLVGTAAVFAVGWLIYIFGVYLLGRNVFHLPISALQTWDFLGLVFSGLANVFLVRERSWFWASRPGRFLLSAAAMDILAVGLMAILGLLLTPIPWSLVVLLLGLTLVYLLLLDVIKVPIMSFALNRHGKSLNVS